MTSLHERVCYNYSLIKQRKLGNGSQNGSQNSFLTGPVMLALERLNSDQRIIYAERTWEQFQLIRAGFTEARGIRLFYANQWVEILMPGQPHELFKSIIGLLIETFLIARNCEFEPTGAMDLVREGIVFAQADESYSFPKKQEMPDLAIEIVFTSGNLSKLARYELLGVPEVWFWEDGALALYHRRSLGYEKIDRSELPAFQGLDIQLLTRCILLGETSRLSAVNAFKAGI
jgi:Uma2 family endonuclease